MSIKTKDLTAPAAASDAGRIMRANKVEWGHLLLSPLWLCLLLALAVRIWLVVRTKGFIEGDEVLTGIQAQHILRGEWPVYFYGQPYMGSLEAYLIALLFALFGTSVWILRVEPIVLSLVLVGLTWKLASVLADEAGLSLRFKRVFATTATLIAAIPPLYDILPELHTWGGYIETFILILLLFIGIIRLTQRWKEGATWKELTWRWAGVGFVIGLALWVYPLIIPAIVTAACWVLFSCAVMLIKNYQDVAAHGQSRSLRTLLRPLSQLWSVLVAIPAALCGFTPGLIWGFSHGWENILYILNTGGGIFQRLGAIKQVTVVYAKCVVPRVISGAVPAQDASPSLHKLLLVGGAICIAGVLLLVLFSVLQAQPLLTQVRRLTLFPLLFCVWTSFSFVTSKNALSAITPFCQFDHSGRYAVPLTLVLPFVYAALVVCALQLLQRYGESTGTRQTSEPENASGARSLTTLAQIGLVLTVILAGYTGAQAMTYQKANVPYIFESPYCHYAPIDDTPVVRYLESQHVHYAWSTNWIAYRILFETSGRIVITDAMAVLPPYMDFDRLPTNTQAVSHADRPALVIFVSSSDHHPPLLQQLDSMGVQYTSARFAAMSGNDILVAIPLNKTVSPLTSSTIASNFTNCYY